MSKTKTVTVHPMYEGTFSVGLDKKFIPIKRRDDAQKGALKLAINPFLIQTGDKNILFDAGLGEFGEGTSTETILNNLAGFGLTEKDVTDIFASHLHYDHLGGLAGRSDGYLELTFPNAKLWVSGNEWDKLMNLDGATDNETAIEFIHFLDAKADLHFLSDGSKPYPEIRVEEAGGHTEFSQILFFETEDQTYMMAGDIIGRKMAVLKKFTAKFDFDPEKCRDLREQLKKRALDEDYIIMAYHEPDYPMFKIVDFDSTQGYLTKHIFENEAD